MNLSSLTSSSSSILPLSNYRPSSRPTNVYMISSSLSTAMNGRSCNFYKLLSLSSETANMAEIKQAYRSMALRYHPDVCRDDSAKEEWTRVFVQLNAAYETLSNPQLREEYDWEVLGLRRRMATTVSVEISDERLRESTSSEKQKRRSNRSSSTRTQRMKHRR